MLSEKIKHTLKKYKMIEGKRVAVAFSGGADSVALLHFLHSEGYAPEAIHINHGIRGEEADHDQEFCRLFCEKRSIPFVTVNVDVPAEAKRSGEGLEEAARRLRYAEIEAVMEAEGIDITATAHHADDNMETVLFNLTRGSSIKGAGGIPPIRGRYVRPLIECTRQEILDYCRENFLEYVTDSTNNDTDYTRNFIRHKIAPLLKSINPEAASAFATFASSARRDSDFIDSMARGIDPDTKRSELSALHPALLSRFIYLRCDELGHIPQSRAVEQLISAIAKGNEFKSVDMGAGIKAVCDRDELRFVKDDAEELLCKTELCTGKNELDGFGCVLLYENEEEWKAALKKEKISHYVFIAKDNIKGRLYARGRQNGDSYRFANMTRSLKKLYNSRKLTVAQRSTLPLVCDEEGIMWIPGFPQRDTSKPQNGQKEIFIGYKR